MNAITPLLTHQLEAVDAFYEQSRSNNVLIGDAPRVGKTLTAIALCEKWLIQSGEVGKGRVLVVSFGLRPQGILN